ncbi:heme peroxidase, partial [Blyttiomyces helicus]
LQAIVAALTPLVAKYGVSAADLIQFSAAIAIVTCNPGPKIGFVVGRQDAVAPNSPGRMPDTKDTITNILNRFLDMNLGLTTTMVVALLGSHS